MNRNFEQALDTYLQSVARRFHDEESNLLDTDDLTPLETPNKYFVPASQDDLEVWVNNWLLQIPNNGKLYLINRDDVASDLDLLPSGLRFDSGLDFDLLCMEVCVSLYDNSERHQLADRLVKNEVYHCASVLVSWLYQSEKLCKELQETLEEIPFQEESEVLEYWAVSSWLTDKLKAFNECVFELADFHMWGRTTSGQQIACDSVITTIACYYFGNKHD